MKNLVMYIILALIVGAGWMFRDELRAVWSNASGTVSASFERETVRVKFKGWSLNKTAKFADAQVEVANNGDQAIARYIHFRCTAYKNGEEIGAQEDKLRATEPGGIPPGYGELVNVGINLREVPGGTMTAKCKLIDYR